MGSLAINSAYLECDSLNPTQAQQAIPQPRTAQGSGNEGDPGYKHRDSLWVWVCRWNHITCTWWLLIFEAYCPRRFHVNLLCGEEQGADAALHFNPRLDTSEVVFNTKEQGKWGREERGTGIPFERGQPFEVLLIATEEGFKVGL